MSKESNPLMQGIEIGMERSKEVLALTLTQLRELKDNAENVIYVKDSIVKDLSSDISRIIGQLESHIEDEFGEEYAEKLGIETGLFTTEEDDDLYD